MVITFQNGWGAKGIDFQLDPLRGSTGKVSFFAFDMAGKLITPAGGINSFSFPYQGSGQQVYRGLTADGTLIHQIWIEGTASTAGSDAIGDIKHVFVQGFADPPPPVPQPSSFVLSSIAIGIFGTIWLRRRLSQLSCFSSARVGAISDSETQRSNSLIVDFAISVLWFLAAIPIALALWFLLPKP
jgi:hypothetical protein